MLVSMTSLLTHTVAHLPGLPIGPKPITDRKSKSYQKWQNSDFQSQFSMSKIIQMFLNFFQ